MTTRRDKIGKLIIIIGRVDHHNKNQRSIVKFAKTINFLRDDIKSFFKTVRRVRITTSKIVNKVFD